MTTPTMKEFLENLHISSGKLAGAMAHKREVVEEIVNNINKRVKDEKSDESSKLKKYQYLYKELRVRTQKGMDFTGGPFKFSSPWTGMHGEIGKAYEELGYNKEDLPPWEVQPIKTMVTFKKGSPGICDDCFNTEFEPENDFLQTYEYEHLRFYDILNHFINDTYMCVGASQMYDEILDDIIARDGETYPSTIIKILFKNGHDYFYGTTNCYVDSAVEQHKKLGKDQQFNREFAGMKIDHHFMNVFLKTDPMHFDTLNIYRVNKHKLCTECQKHVSPLHLDMLGSK